MSEDHEGQKPCVLLFIFAGYICGVISKLAVPSFKWYVLFFYLLNLLIVGLNLLLCVRNYRLDKLAEKTEERVDAQ